MVVVGEVRGWWDELLVWWDELLVWWPELVKFGELLALVGRAVVSGNGPIMCILRGSRCLGDKEADAKYIRTSSAVMHR